MTPEQPNLIAEVDLMSPEEAPKMELSPDTLDAEALKGVTAALGLYRNQVQRKEARAVQELDRILGAQGTLDWDDETRQLLFDAHLMRVVRAARKYPLFNYDMLDLIQEGNIGLFKAVQEYAPEEDPLANDEAGYEAFSKYAYLKIKTHISAAVRKMHVASNNIQAALNWLAKDADRLRQELGREPTIDELAAAGFMTPEQIKTLLSYRQTNRSIDGPLRVGGRVYESGASLPDHDYSTEDEVEAIMTERELIQYLKSCVSPRDLDIFLRASGLGGHEEEPRLQIAHSYSLVVPFVSQIIQSVRREASVFLGYEQAVRQWKPERKLGLPIDIMLADVAALKSEALHKVQEATSGDEAMQVRLIETLLQTLPHSFGMYLRARYRLNEDEEGPRRTLEETAEVLSANKLTVREGCRHGMLRLINNIPAVLQNDFDGAKIPLTTRRAASPLSFLYVCGVPLRWDQSAEERVDLSLRIIREYMFDVRQENILRSLYGIDAPVRTAGQVAEDYSLGKTGVHRITNHVLNNIRAALKPADQSDRTRLI